MEEKAHNAVIHYGHFEPAKFQLQYLFSAYSKYSWDSEATPNCLTGWMSPLSEGKGNGL